VRRIWALIVCGAVWGVGAVEARPVQNVQADQNISALVVFAKFQGEAGGDTAPAWANGLFDPSLQGSFSHFYNEMSRGRLRLKGQVLPRRYTSSGVASSYVAAVPGTRGDFGRFNLEILSQVDADTDLGLFDNDGPDGVPNSGDDDGRVDIVFINLQTVPRDFFIGGATGFATLGLETDFISDDPAVGGGFIRIPNRFSGFGGTTQRGHTFEVTAGTMCHEFGHVLGLDDLFDQSSLTANGQLEPELDSAGIGKWGLMGLGTLGWDEARVNGPNAFSAFSLAELGWVEVEEVASSRTGLRLDDMLASGRIVKLPIRRHEYYLLEYRRASGSYYNRNIPADGLLIWHVEERADNDEERHKKVDLVCADGLYSDRGFPGGGGDVVTGGDNLDFWSKDNAYVAARNGNQGDATDPFDGVRFRRFAWDTNPRLSAYTGLRRGLPLGIAVDNMRPDGDGMLVDILWGQPLEGHISGDQRWEGIVEINADLVIEPGARLRLAPGTTLRFARGDARSGGFDPEQSEVLVLGRLDIEGTPEEPVRLEGADGIGNSWSGIFLLDGQNLDEENLQIANASRGIVRSRLPAGTSRWQGRIDLPGDVWVPADAELVIEPGTLLRFGGEDLMGSGINPQLSELVVQGRLHLAGVPGEPVRLTTTSLGRDEEEVWYGVRMVEGGRVEIDQTQIDQSGFAVSGKVSPQGALRLSNSLIGRSFGGLSLKLNGEAVVEGTRFTGITSAAVHAEGDGHLLLRDVEIVRNGREGILLRNCSLEALRLQVESNGSLDPDDPRAGLAASGGSGARIEVWNSAFGRNEAAGLDLAAWQGEVEIHESRIVANRGDGLLAGALERLVFEGVEVDRNLGRGAVITGGTVELWTSSFTDNIGVGLFLGGGVDGAVDMSRFLGNAGMQVRRSGVLVVRNSDFSNGLVALETENSPVVLHGNTFDNNRTAIQVSGVIAPGEISDNVFTDNRLAIDNRSGRLLNASGNFWGTTDPEALAALFAGEVDFSPFLEVDPTATAVLAEDEVITTRLRGHFPNPFNAQTTIRFDLARAGRVRLLVSDVLGRQVRLLADATLGEGNHQRSWDGRDGAGRPVGSGVYFYRLEALDYKAVDKVLLLR
jgi:M6 family metalloprotease-like protein